MNIIPTARTGSEWTSNELLASNITVVNEDVAAFFNVPNLPQPTVDPIILNHVNAPPGPLSKSNRLFFRYLRDAMSRLPSGPLTEAAVNDFASFLLGMLDYDEPNGVVHQQLEIGFIMCGQRVHATPDICVMDADDYILLVQQDKRQIAADDPEPQLIAGAIAAFYENNRCRRQVGLPTIPAKVFAGITLTGTAPTFYKIPVTEALLLAITTSQLPDQQTVVRKFIPPVPDIVRFSEGGMRPLENRAVVLQCFEAFKQFF